MQDCVSIVILNYKNWQDTIECLNAAFEITYCPYRIIVVDNDSQNDSISHISSWLERQGKAFLSINQKQSETEEYIDSPLVLIQSSSNCGYAAGNNIGIRWAIRAEDNYVVILNNDTIANNNLLEMLVDFLKNNNDSVMAGPLLTGVDGKIDRSCARKRPGFWDYFFRTGPAKRLWPKNPWCQSDCYFERDNKQLPIEVEVISGACVCIKTQFLKDIGLLDENTFLFAEEYILTEQARQRIKKIYIVPESIVVHKHGASTKLQRNLTIQKHVLHSHYYYLTKYRKLSSIQSLVYLLGPTLLFVKIWISEKIQRN